MQRRHLLRTPLLEATVRQLYPPMNHLPWFAGPQRKSTDHRLSLHRLQYFHLPRALVHEHCLETGRSLYSI